jgi:hypothetical protein
MRARMTARYTVYGTVESSNVEAGVMKWKDRRWRLAAELPVQQVA